MIYSPRISYLIPEKMYTNWLSAYLQTSSTVMLHWPSINTLQHRPVAVSVLWKSRCFTQLRQTVVLKLRLEGVAYMEWNYHIYGPHKLKVIVNPALNVKSTFSTTPPNYQVHLKSIQLPSDFHPSFADSISCLSPPCLPMDPKTSA